MKQPKVRLDENWRYSESPRVNAPIDYIQFLKTEPRFKRCGLDDLPKHAIILHDAEAPEHLVRLGYTVEDIRLIETGTTDPNVMWLVHGKNQQPDFILNRGLPGAGGIATQAAELGALGIESLVHIGTCGLVGEHIKSGNILLSQGSFKDAGATMLSPAHPSQIDPVAHPDPEMTAAIKNQLAAAGLPHSSATGYTIPIFYFQPAELIIDLITGEAFPSGPPVAYFEMEEASFFQTCTLMKKRAASMVVGADRYSLKDGQLSHKFEDDVDQDAAKLKMIQAALAAFKSLA
jgi:uridine phosphorylase